jgi:hypothetical protein
MIEAGARGCAEKGRGEGPESARRPALRGFPLRPLAPQPNRKIIDTSEDEASSRRV